MNNDGTLDLLPHYSQVNDRQTKPKLWTEQNLFKWGFLSKVEKFSLHLRLFLSRRSILQSLKLTLQYWRGVSITFKLCKALPYLFSSLLASLQKVKTSTWMPTALGVKWSPTQANPVCSHRPPCHSALQLQECTSFQGRPFAITFISTSVTSAHIIWIVLSSQLLQATKDHRRAAAASTPF